MSTSRANARSAFIYGVPDDPRDRTGLADPDPRGRGPPSVGFQLLWDTRSLRLEALVRLNEVAEALTKGDPSSLITIEGHTDSQGSHDYNMELAQRRADAVKQQLISHGVAADRVRAVGIGPDRPLADNRSAEGRANNRRVEIIIGGAGSTR